MTEIFITGATGFIGSHALNKLLELNKFRIIALTRGKKDNSEGVTFVEGDIHNVTLINALVKQVDYVVHIAGCKNDAMLFFETNVKGTTNIIEACMNNNRLKKLIYLSSVGVIGTSSEPIINEKTECCPNNEYEKSKYQAELIVRKYAQHHPNKVVILRPTNVFGEDDPELHLLNLIRKVKNHRFYFVGKDIPNYYLNYLYVKEISELIPKLLDSNTINNLYILNTPTQLPEFIMTIKEILMDNIPVKHLPYWPVKMVAMFFDFIPKGILKHPPINTAKLIELTNKKQYSSSLLQRDLNWKPAFEIKEAINNLITHYYQKKLLI